MRSTFKVIFYVKKGSEKPNGNLPLMCRITVDGEVKQFSCKMDNSPNLWDVKNNGHKPPLSGTDADGRLCYRYQTEKCLPRNRGKAGNAVEAVRTAQRRICEESRAQQGARDFLPLPYCLQTHPGVSSPDLPPGGYTAQITKPDIY